MTTFDDVLPRLDGVEGWLSDDQARSLFETASRCPPGGRIVEIGSFRGRSTIVIASAADPSVEIVAIDPHAGNDRGPQEIEGYAEEASRDRAAFEANLTAAGVRDRVRHVRAFSAAAHDDVKDPVDFLYIDGAHRYRPARDDIRDWGARVADGGSLAIHDSFSSIGVTFAILTQLMPSRRFRYVGRARSLALYRADLSASSSSRRGNAARQLAQLVWFARNVGLKVLLSLGLGKVMRKFGWRVPDWPY